MLMQAKRQPRMILFNLCLVLLFVLCSCVVPAMPGSGAQATAQNAEHSDELPKLNPVSLANGEKLHVVATMNILGDVVKNVGGDQIELTTLLPVGADPHSYSAAPEDLRTLSAAHVVFLVGEGVEESMMSVLENREGASALVAVNTGIDLMKLPEGAEHAEEEAHEAGEEEHHHDLDPHTWTAVPSVIHWVETIEHTLSALDPANAATYQANAAAYTAKLEQLDTEIETAVAAIPAENRKLVTDHDVFGYFAARYGFTVIGAVVPSLSTLSEPSAQELAALQDQIESEGVRAIFVGTTVNPELEQQIANDLGINVVSLYTESLSAADGPAPTYIDFMRYNVNAIVGALK